jgi:ATP-binding cassette subfamily F protein uup
MSTPIFYIRNGNLAFGSKILLQNTELYIKSEDRVCLIGRNGSGKSSLLKILDRTYELDTGQIYKEPGVTIGYLKQDIHNSFANITIFDFVTKEIPQELHYKADMILEELQLDKTLLMEHLSGGQFRRSCLAQILITEPSILLLDEPTNHLDIELIEWLENYIKNYPGAVICISHDKAFLSNVTNKIWWLDRSNLRKSEKGFKYFDIWQEEVLQREESELIRLNKKLATENVWLSQGVTARRKRNQRRLSQLHLLRERLKTKNNNTNILNQKMKKIYLGEVKKTTFIFEMTEVSFYFTNKPIIHNFSVKVEKGDKIGIIGPNGSGKSTFLKLIMGELQPTSGKIKSAKNLSVTYFDQARSDLKDSLSIKDTLCGNNNDYVINNGREIHIASYLKQFMFDPRELNTKVSTLSGGEKNRLLLAKILINPTDVLILDEPTNDLDMDSIEMLLETLTNYSGTLIIVSHDRDFLENLVLHTLVFSKQMQISDIVGSYYDWMKLNPNANTPILKSKKVEYTHKLSTHEKSSNKSNKLTYKDQLLLDTLPSKIEVLENENRKLELALSDESLYLKNPKKFDEYATQLEQNKIKINDYILTWSEIDDKKL